MSHALFIRRALGIASAVALTVALITAGDVAGAASRSPGGLIVFSSDLTGTTEIWTVHPDGTAMTQLTHSPSGSRQWMPEWSPDGGRLLFASDRSGGAQIYVMNADGSSLHRLLKDPNGQDDHAFWSPDGTRIVFERVAAPYYHSRVYVMRADGTGATPITANRWNSFEPSFSPDGARILFDSDAGGYQSRLFTMHTDGSHIQVLASPPALEAFWPAFAPGGSPIDFTSSCCKPDARQVYSLAPDGTVAELTGPSSTVSSAMEDPSPDGSQLVYESDAGHAGQWDLWVMSADGSGQTQITHGPVSTFDDVFPDWGPAAA